MIEIYHKGNLMGISADENNEAEFITGISLLFESMIEDPDFTDSWSQVFNELLKNIVDICCKYRGHKSGVIEQRVMYAGAPMIDKKYKIASIDNCGSISKKLKNRGTR